MRTDKLIWIGALLVFLLLAAVVFVPSINASKNKNELSGSENQGKNKL